MAIGGEGFCSRLEVTKLSSLWYCGVLPVRWETTPLAVAVTVRVEEIRIEEVVDREIVGN